MFCKRAHFEYLRVWPGKLTHAHRHVIQAITARADKDGRVRQPLAVLAEAAGCVVSTAKAAINSLLEAGLLTWTQTRKERNRYDVNHYQLLRPGSAPVPVTKRRKPKGLYEPRIGNGEVPRSRDEQIAIILGDKSCRSQHPLRPLHSLLTPPTGTPLAGMWRPGWRS